MKRGNLFLKEAASKYRLGLLMKAFFQIMINGLINVSLEPLLKLKLSRTGTMFITHSDSLIHVFGCVVLPASLRTCSSDTAACLPIRSLLYFSMLTEPICIQISNHFSLRCSAHSEDVHSTPLRMHTYTDLNQSLSLRPRLLPPSPFLGTQPFLSSAAKDEVKTGSTFAFSVFWKPGAGTPLPHQPTSNKLPGL